MIDGREQLSEEEAQRVWKRATDLQAEAADPALRAPTVLAQSRQATGYSLSQVREAAIEVGISPEFIALALAEGEESDPGPGD